MVVLDHDTFLCSAFIGGVFAQETRLALIPLWPIGRCCRGRGIIMQIPQLLDRYGGKYRGRPDLTVGMRIGTAHHRTLVLILR